MFTLVIILSIIASILLTLIVLIQNPKGGGIAANFSAANQIAGVKRTNDFIEKATWTLAVALLVFSLSSGYLYSGKSNQESIMQEQLEQGPTSVEAPLMNQEKAGEFNDGSMQPSGTPDAEPTPAPTPDAEPNNQ